ncbi:glutathione synthase [Chryseobacterium sp. L7]|uniref:Glutathione synthase n=1 Tax=Chryseobacterium endalhagicum TaxID=2797638 RepID=A0ABS1QEH6_9FLAO|nr:glutathione synthase [Chryseobacterium endalhagicum]MBL1221000.1 glutathione synthase [Chryseobacterium endalhagicum]
MLQKNFTKAEFVLNSENQYQLEYTIEEIGQGSNLTVEKKKDDGEFETLQVMITRLNDHIFIKWSEPFDGRLIFEK